MIPALIHTLSRDGPRLHALENGYRLAGYDRLARLSSMAGTIAAMLHSALQELEDETARVKAEEMEG